MGEFPYFLMHHPVKREEDNFNVVEHSAVQLWAFTLFKVLFNIWIWTQKTCIGVSASLAGRMYPIIACFLHFASPFLLLVLSPHLDNLAHLHMITFMGEPPSFVPWHLRQATNVSAYFGEEHFTQTFFWQK